MRRLRFYKCFLFAPFLFLIAGCAYPISKELRQEATKEVTFPMVLRNPTAYFGSIVIWGGKIIETQNVARGSELFVLETPLDYQEMPEAEKYSQGRFIARSSTFLDPEVYKKGKKITVAGEVIGKETKPLGKTAYTYPVILVKQIHLWKKYRAYYASPPAYYYGPYYRPYDWYGSYSPYSPYDRYGWPYDYYDNPYDFDNED